MTDQIKPQQKSPEDLKRLRDLQLGDFPPNMTTGTNPLETRFPIEYVVAFFLITFVLAKLVGTTYLLMFIYLIPPLFFTDMYALHRISEIRSRFIEVDFYDKRKTSFIVKIKDPSLTKIHFIYSSFLTASAIYFTVNMVYAGYCKGSGCY